VLDSDEISNDDLTRLYRTVAKRCPTRMQPYDIEDLVQDMLLDAVKASKKTGIPIVPLAFANAKRMRYYKRASSSVLPLRDFTEKYVGPVAETVASRAQWLDVDDMPDVWDMSMALDLDDLVNRLPYHQAAAFQIHVIEDRTLEETSRRLGFSVSTIHEHVKAAREAVTASYLDAT
jgi:DNA-directed RNA polymerase specialized sigma24 family protein